MPERGDKQKEKKKAGKKNLRKGTVSWVWLEPSMGSLHSLRSLPVFYLFIFFWRRVRCCFLSAKINKERNRQVTLPAKRVLLELVLVLVLVLVLLGGALRRIGTGGSGVGRLLLVPAAVGARHGGQLRDSGKGPGRPGLGRKGPGRPGLGRKGWGVGDRK